MSFKPGQTALFMGQQVPIIRCFDEIGNERSYADLPLDQVLIEWGPEWKLIRVSNPFLVDQNPTPPINANALKELLDGI